MDSDPAVSICFAVRIDGVDLGAFTGCEGLACEVTVEQREEGGNNGYVHQLPGRLRYSNVRLTRPVNADTTRVAAWFAAMAHEVRRTTAVIAALRADGSTVASWSLGGVMPVRWEGPTLRADLPRVALETLEIAHHGFLPVGRG